MGKYNRIALIGLDGSGKSANISKMKTDTDYKNYCFIWVRWKPILLKPLYWIMGKKVRKLESHDEKNLGKSIKLNLEYDKKTKLKEKIFKKPGICKIWMNLALIDYFFQFYAKTIYFLVRRKAIIFDRFYLDLFIDQGINFGYSTDKIISEIKKYQKLFPRIDKIIYLKVSPEVCYKRKKDIPNMDYLFRRYDIYEELCKSVKWIIVDGEELIEDVYVNIKQNILINM